jgi:hypothetical protein
VRYHLLRATGTLRTIGVCLGLLGLSYVAAALVNAAPVTQPVLVGPFERGRVIVLTPAQPQPSDALPIEVHAAQPAPAPAATPSFRTL